MAAAVTEIVATVTVATSGYEEEYDMDISADINDIDHIIPCTSEPDDNHQASLSSSEPLLDFTQPYPTDPCLFKKESLSTAKVRAIVQHGPCQPGLKDNFSDFVTNSFNEKFKIHWYKNTNGKCSVARHWLVYSPLAGKMFCHCSWLFAKNKNVFGLTLTRGLMVSTKAWIE